MILPDEADGVTYKTTDATESTNLTQAEIDILRARSPVDGDQNLFYGVGYTDNASSPTGDLF